MTTNHIGVKLIESFIKNKLNLYKTKAFQIIIPKPFGRVNEIEIYTYAKDFNNYVTKVNSFIKLDNNGKPARSLYFQDFSDNNFEYLTHNQQDKNENNENESDEDKFNFNIENHLISRLDFKEEFKEEWIKIFKDYGKSTLYSSLQFSDPNNNNNNNDGILSYFIVFDESISSETNIDKKTNIDKEAKKFLIYFFLSIYREVLKASAIKSATAAIMARNMSHNLGSHILFYLKTVFSNIPEQWKNLLYELEKKDDGNFHLNVAIDLIEKIKINGIKKDISAPFLTGVGKFLGYLQERQDFIATIASNFIPYYGTVNFKDFIYDELNPDLKVIRHNKEIGIRNILLDFIAESEGYSRKGKDNIRVYFKNFNGTDINHTDLEYLRSIKMDMPAGIMGRQAFFSIFENIIRNSAKHSPENPEKSNKDLIIKFDVQKDKRHPDYWKVIISDNNNNYAKVEKAIRKGLQDDYIDDKGELKHENKGIKEMRISAAWLRGYNVADINERDIEPKILDIEKVNENLGYVFYIPISKKLVYITTESNKKEVKLFENKEEYKVVTIDEYLQLDSTNYRITLIDENIDENNVNKIKQKAPVRILTNISINYITENKDANKLYLKAYRDWLDNDLKGFIKDDKIHIVIFDSNNNNGNDKEAQKYIYHNTNDSITIKNNKLNEKLIVFRKHNDTKTEFLDFKQNEVYKTSIFIEGITGHNSTERLLRYEDKNLEWVYKLTEAALTKVLIIDERIFNRFALPKIQKNIDITVEEILNNVTNKELLISFLKKEKNIKQEKIDSIDLEIETICKEEIQDKDKEDIARDIIGFISNNKAIEKTTEEENLKKEIYEKKNITIFNIIPDNDGSVKVYDLNDNPFLEIYNEGEVLSFKKIGDNNYNLLEFDFVLIHQGILDKFYDTFKDKNISKKNKWKKTIWKIITEIFPAKHKHIIHSGRSKPNDLPDNVGFNQFSSVETALFDCKLSLSDLLYSVRNEK